MEDETNCKHSQNQFFKVIWKSITLIDYQLYGTAFILYLSDVNCRIGFPRERRDKMVGIYCNVISYWQLAEEWKGVIIILMYDHCWTMKVWLY